LILYLFSLCVFIDRPAPKPIWHRCAMVAPAVDQSQGTTDLTFRPLLTARHSDASAWLIEREITD
jgi:hypothetical protein